ncbi:zinc finger CCCH-type antiviral protein 1-like [Mantella aurantiaca]
MSDPAVSAYLTKLLCSHGGRLERYRLPDLLDLPEAQIEQILQDESFRFPQSSQLVLAQSALRICTQYLRPGGEEYEEKCPKLHLCRHYLRGQCPPNRRPRCRFNHDVLSDHNRAVLKANELSGLNEDEIKVLLFQNDSQLLPENCQKYKQEDCDQGEDCTRLHVCSFFTQAGCNRRFCKKSHNLLDSNLLSTCSWLSKVTIQNFQMLCMLRSQERQQASKEAPRGERGISRGRGRGGPGYRRRAGSQDLLDSKSRERRTEGSHVRCHSTSRPRSQFSVGQRSREEDYNDSDSSSDHGRYPRTRLNDIMDDWFTPNTLQAEKAQFRSSAGVTSHEGTRSVPPTKGFGMSSRVDKPLMLQTPDQPTGSLNSRSTSELTRASYNTRKADYGSFNGAGVAPVPLHESYQPNKVHARYPSVQERPTVSPRSEQSVYYPTSLTASSKPTLSTLKSDLSITSPKLSTITSTSFNSSREYPATQQKPTYVSSSSSLNRPVHHSTGGLSNAETVSPFLTVYNHSEISSTKTPSTANQITDMELGKELESSLARLSIVTPSKTSLYPTTESSYITQSTLATATVSDLMGASSSSSSTNIFVGADIHSRKLQATVKPSVKPIIKNEKTSGTQYSLLDEDFDFDYYCHPLMATKSTAAQPQPVTIIPSIAPGKSSLDKTPEICLTNIWKHCSLEGMCANMHYYLPYRWQVFNGTDWDDFPNMEDIEKAYSDPKIDRYQLIDFEAMKSSFKPVRRLATPSSVTQPPEYVLTTEWCWYWKNESGVWTEYGKLDTENINTTILSSDLETIYLSDPTGIIPFTAGNQIYDINCREMKQRNTHFKTERAVRRRPKFLDFQDVKMLRGSTKSAIDSFEEKQSDTHLKNGIYPSLWDLEAITDIGYTQVLLSQNSSEFRYIVALFSKTISDHTVKQIWRVQNSALWKQYQGQKDEMKKKNLSSTVNEKQLFHGTNPAYTDAICRENFDRHVCSISNIAYGQGSYFSLKASYSHNYSPPDSTGMRTMFLAKVLVGDFIEGNPTMIRPPQKYRSSQSYDSCVDNVYNPSIFVVFEKYQVYPEYILEYQERKTPCIVN